MQDITFHYLKNIDLPLKYGRLDFGHEKSLRKRREKGLCVSVCMSVSKVCVCVWGGRCSGLGGSRVLGGVGMGVLQGEGERG